MPDCDFCGRFINTSASGWTCGCPGEAQTNKQRAQAVHDAKLLADAQALDEAYASATGPAEAYERDLRALVDAAQIAVSSMSAETQFIPLMDLRRIRDGLRTALEQFEPWLEADNDDPRANGWVDDKGRP